MNILIIAGSQRPDSRSAAIADLIRNRLENTHPECETDIASLGDMPAQWRFGEAVDTSGLAQRVRAADGFVILAPEWNGMATPALKNLFLLEGENLFANKPAALIGVSEGAGGVYPMAELRMSAHKNTLICFTPVGYCIRKASAFIADTKAAIADGAKIPETWDRVDYSLDVLLAYTKALSAMRRAQPDLAGFRYTGF
ncbi:MAG TPA: NAD(P)H-dependent oxidoreductase [Saliniramus sp.]|nr:NAD(P)H-dependent oxidoreductase [Saliniramus sp.]